jgi:hypothetical protein
MLSASSSRSFSSISAIFLRASIRRDEIIEVSRPRFSCSRRSKLSEAASWATPDLIWCRTSNGSPLRPIVCTMGSAAMYFLRSSAMRALYSRSLVVGIRSTLRGRPRLRFTFSLSWPVFGASWTGRMFKIPSSSLGFAMGFFTSLISCRRGFRCRRPPSG